MHFNNFATTLVLALATSVAQGGVLAPAVAPAIPAVHAVPAPIAYHHAIPFNVPPYSDRVDIHNKILSFAAVPAVPALPAVHAIPAVPTLHAVPHGAPHYVPGPVAAPVATPVLPHHVPFAYGHPGVFAAPVPAEFGAPFSHSLPAAVGLPYPYDHPFVSAPAPALAAPFLRR